MRRLTAAPLRRGFFFARSTVWRVVQYQGSAQLNPGGAESLTAIRESHSRPKCIGVTFKRIFQTKEETMTDKQLGLRAQPRERGQVDAGPARDLRVSRSRHQGRHQGRLRRPPHPPQRQEDQGRGAAVARARLHVPARLRPERLGDLRVRRPGPDARSARATASCRRRASSTARSPARTTSRCWRSSRRPTSRRSVVEGAGGQGRRRRSRSACFLPLRGRKRLRTRAPRGQILSSFCRERSGRGIFWSGKLVGQLVLETSPT